jgi:hypothetical protein
MVQKSRTHGCVRADRNLDKDLGETPSILQVFKPSEASPPLEMTLWDRALLLALYSTPRRKRVHSDVVIG